LTNFELTTYL